jgi:hypothetical protein
VARVTVARGIVPVARVRESEKKTQTLITMLMLRDYRGIE